MQTVDAKQRLLVLSPKLIDTKYYCTSTLVMKDKSKEPNLLKEGNKYVTGLPKTSTINLVDALEVTKVSKSEMKT
jgi:hypothetical protein